MYLLLSLLLFVAPTLALASDLPLMRVFYHPDGAVSVMHFVKEACLSGEAITACMDRVTLSGSFKDLPYDDMAEDQLPPDRAQRDQWRGAKGKGIWVDSSIITRDAVLAQLSQEIDKELEKEQPDAAKVLKLQHQLIKVKDMGPTLTQEQIEALHPPSFFSRLWHSLITFIEHYL